MSETEVTTEAVVEVIDDLDTFSTDFFSGKSKQEPEAAKPEEVEQDDSDEETGEVESEAQATDDTDEDTETEEEVVEPPKKKTVQDRIDELVKQREDAKREGEAQLAQLRQEFEEKLASLQTKQPEPTTSTDKAAGEPTPDDLNEDGTPKYSLGEFDPQYVRDLTKFTFDQARQQAEVETAQKAQEAQELEARTALTNEWNGKVEVAKVAYPDFQEKATGLLNGFNNLDTNYASYLSTVLMSMDHGTDVLYYLSNHPDEATKIVNSGAQKATLALGRIEAKFYEAEQQKQAAKPKVSKAPPPPAIQARGTNGAFVAIAPDTDDLDAFTSEFYKKRK